MATKKKIRYGIMFEDAKSSKTKYVAKDFKTKYQAQKELLRNVNQKIGSNFPSIAVAKKYLPFVHDDTFIKVGHGIYFIQKYIEI